MPTPWLPCVPFTNKGDNPHHLVTKNSKKLNLQSPRTQNVTLVYKTTPLKLSLIAVAGARNQTAARASATLWSLLFALFGHLFSPRSSFPLTRVTIKKWTTSGQKHPVSYPKRIRCSHGCDAKMGQQPDRKHFGVPASRFRTHKLSLYISVNYGCHMAPG